MESVYLDYNATTPIDPEVASAMEPYLREKFGNPSSIHSFGRVAKNAVEEAREKVARLIGAEPEEILFTSGGTESNHTVIAAITKLHPNGEIVTSAVEHPSVLESCRNSGLTVKYLSPDGEGRIYADSVEEALGPKTSLISIMTAQNVLGTIQPIEEIARLCRDKKILCHTDAVQGAGKIPLDVNKIPVDFLSLAAHKIYGPKGTGALFIRRGTKIPPLFIGGHQEKDRRAGTENVAGIVGFGVATRIAKQRLEEDCRRWKGLKNHILDRLQSLFPSPGLHLISPDEDCLSNTIHLAIKGVPADVMVMNMDMEGFAISAGAACAAGAVEPSYIHRAMGLSKEIATSAIRISLGRYTTTEEVDAFTMAFNRVVQRVKTEKVQRSP
jgi:cysteine desulfurase